MLPKTEFLKAKLKNIFSLPFVVFLLSFLLFSLFLTPPTSQAACYCDPIRADCRCQTTPPPSATYPTVEEGIPLSCDTQYEANTYYSRINPICGTNTETIPYCTWAAGAPDTNCHIICWGTQWTTDTGNIGDQERAYEQWGNTVRFNTFDSSTFAFCNGGIADQLTACRADVYCCGEPSNCNGQGNLSYNSCPDSYGNITPPDWCPTNPGPPGPPVQPTPFPGDYSCDEDTGDGAEFHTYRPYQASPCNTNKEDLALMCGNSLTLRDFPESLFSPGTGGSCSENDPLPSPPPGEQTSCCVISTYQNGDGKITCRYKQNIHREFAIDLAGAELPIMGNTEDVVNHANETDTYTDEQKVNEYVSWYLNGVNSNPAEYGPLDPRNDETAIDRLINFSGPLKKLMPHRKYRDIIAGSGSIGTDDEQGQVQEAGDTRHDQIVGCVVDAFRNLFDPGDWGKVEECYHGGHTMKKARLSTWENDIPPREEDFPNFKDWYYAYRRWHGDFCIRIFGLGWCVNNPFDPDWPATLFYDSPFSSTEDRVGDVEVKNLEINQVGDPGLIFSDVVVTTTPADLFFAHMEETLKLARDLQKTFVPKGEIDTLGEINVAPSATNPYCDLVRVRSNPGDNLFAGEIQTTLDYNVEYRCTYNELESDPSAPGYDDGDYCTGSTSWGPNGEPPGLGAECQHSSQSPEHTYCQTDYGRVDCCNVGDPTCNNGLGQTCCSGGWETITNDGFCEIESGGTARCVPNNYSGPSCILYPDDAGDPIPCPGNNFKCVTGVCNGPGITSLPNVECTYQVGYTLDLETRTPLIEEVWQRLVAGPYSVFQRIFPSVGPGGALGSIYDIPGATSVYYTPLLEGNPDTFSQAENWIGDPSNERSGPELYFPHVGSLHQYFLQCTQAALRPKGFGPTCPSGPARPGSTEICSEENTGLGFNIHFLASRSEAEIYDLLASVVQCGGPKIVRFWGCQSCHGIDGLSGIGNVLRVAEQSFPDLKFIIALEDFNAGPNTNPTAWYQNNDQPGEPYYNYVDQVMDTYGNHPQILVWELLNEPHCAGWLDCPTPFYNFINAISIRIAQTPGLTAYISPGMMGGYMTWQEYEAINDLPNVTANSCHYYVGYSGGGNPIDVCFEAINHKGNIDFFYVGEAGYSPCGADTCNQGCSTQDYLDRVDAMQADLAGLAPSIDAFVVWDYRTSGCGELSVMPNDPICSSLCDYGESGLPPGPPGSCAEAPPPHCSVDDLLSYCQNDPTLASYASQVCNLESGGVPNRINNRCQTRESYDFSIGLFQINLIAHCPSAFGPNTNPDTNYCEIIDDGTDCSMYDAYATNPITNCNQELRDCIEQYLDPNENRNFMSGLSQSCTSWNAWSNAKFSCNLP
ncbi:hypothetical protein A2Z22_02865 [Candidatus Woesebacteria bacterium RBG_16_34_12]|uniref:Uncharacterized protein n=1 Tax=Candidatus Woesebacteria bacterium RBG_16_34_12 TaxID=1802480 RepID=A0A1F7X7C5_9BACT|nr:MAG: hypothetical protein A2Z22_02865 [Candidatus Woesebacteria bacterium RBG_16_34_12]